MSSVFVDDMVLSLVHDKLITKKLFVISVNKAELVFELFHKRSYNVKFVKMSKLDIFLTKEMTS